VQLGQLDGAARFKIGGIISRNANSPFCLCSSSFDVVTLITANGINQTLVEKKQQQKKANKML